MDKTRMDQVIESNKNIDDMIKKVKEQRGESLSIEEINTLTLTSINKQLVDISVTLAIICDILNKKED